MLRKLFILMLALCLVLPVISAEYLPHKQNTDLSFSITSNNATNCNVSSYNYPNGIIEINEDMTKVGQTFNITIDSGNFSTLGSYCFNIQCYDGSSYETGSVCREVTAGGENNNIQTALVQILITLFFVGLALLVY